MEEAPRRTLSASTPRHPPLVRTSPPRRAKRRGGSRDARAERAPPRPPEAWRRTRRLRGKALPPLQPAVPDGRAEDGDPHRASPRRGHRRRRRAPSSALRLGQGRRARGCGGRRRRAAVATARGSHTQGERRKGKEKRTVLGRRRRRRSPPQPPHGRSGDRAGAEATAPVTPGRATRSRASERACDGKARRDKPLCRGLTFNRSQRGSCSATYETPTQKQVVYEWFSARFHTNVRST